MGTSLGCVDRPCVPVRRDEMFALAVQLLFGV